MGLGLWAQTSQASVRRIRIKIHDASEIGFFMPGSKGAALLIAHSP